MGRRCGRCCGRGDGASSEPRTERGFASGVSGAETRARNQLPRHPLVAPLTPLHSAAAAAPPPLRSAPCAALIGSHGALLTLSPAPATRRAAGAGTAAAPRPAAGAGRAAATAPASAGTAI